jgi:hypothetical protein
MPLLSLNLQTEVLAGLGDLATSSHQGDVMMQPTD